jgi:hypothetical protein
MTKKKSEKPPESREHSDQIIEADGLFPLKGYIILNVIFWLFCILQMGALKWLYRDAMGIIFFFIFLPVGFTLVSIYDYVFDRIASKNKSSQNEIIHEK